MSIKKIVVGLVGAAITMGGPAFAQHSLLFEQPNVGDLHVKEAELESRLNIAYNNGLIDPLELANMHRDLDAIRVKEDMCRMKGLTSGGYRDIKASLFRFQRDLDRRCGEKSNVVALPVVEIR
jgi:hypothetical protein